MGGFIHNQILRRYKMKYKYVSFLEEGESFAHETKILPSPFVRALSPLALAVFPIASFADDDDGSTVYFEEVIVTAERTERSVLDTAMTITGFGEDALKRFGIQDRDKLQILVPGLQFGETVDMLGNGTSLRGIGTRNAGIGHGDRSVATYIEGAYTVGTYGTAPGGGFDLERVEVARGPQGTLNGRNSIAGSINYIYKKPTQERDFELMGQFNDYQQYRVNAAIGGPLTDSISYRLTAGRNDGDGYQENVGPGPDTDAPDHRFYSAHLRSRTIVSAATFDIQGSQIRASPDPRFRWQT